MSDNITLDIPIVIDTSGDITIFADNIDISDANFVFNVIDTSINAETLSNALFYTDDNTGDENNLFKVDPDNIQTFSQEVKNVLLSNVTNFTLVGSTDTVYAPRNNTYAGSLGEHFIQYIASILFGHPLAQAPINNENDIRTQIQSADADIQLYNDFLNDVSFNDGNDNNNPQQSVNGIIMAMFEQLIQYGSSRFETNDSTFIQFPIYSGDVIRFIVRMQGKISSDTSSLNNNTSDTNFVRTAIDLQKVYSYLIDKNYNINNPDDASNLYNHRPLYVKTDASGNQSLYFKPKNWIISFKLGGSDIRNYFVSSNTYTALGTSAKFQFIGNKSYLDSPDPSLYPLRSGFLSFKRDISNATTINASYIANVDVVAYVNNDPFVLSETYDFNAQNYSTGNNDASYVELSLGDTTRDLFKLYDRSHDVYRTDMLLVSGNKQSIRNGRYTVSYGTSSHLIVDNNTIQFYTDKTAANLNDTFIFDGSNSTDISGKYINITTSDVLIAYDSSNIEINSVSYPITPFVYLNDGNYSIANSNFSSTNIDLSANGDKIQLYHSNVTAIDNPFILTYNLTNSDHTKAEYVYINGGSTYTATYYRATNTKITFNSTLMNTIQTAAGETILDITEIVDDIVVVSDTIEVPAGSFIPEAGNYDINYASLEYPDMTINTEGTVVVINTSSTDFTLLYNALNSSLNNAVYTDNTNTYEVSIDTTNIEFNGAIRDVIESSTGLSDAQYNYGSYVYLQSASYDISHASFTEDVDMVVSGQTNLGIVDISSSALRAINDPFTLSFDEVNSSYVSAKYNAVYGATTYELTYTGGSSKEITLNSSIMNAVGSINTDTDISINMFKYQLPIGIYDIVGITGIPDISSNGVEVFIAYQNSTTETSSLQYDEELSTTDQAIYILGADILTFDISNQVTLNANLNNQATDPGIYEETTYQYYPYLQLSGVYRADPSQNTITFGNLIDVSANNEQIQLYEPALLEIENPFILTFDSQDSVYYDAKYENGDYYVRYKIENNEKYITVNDSILNLIEPGNQQTDLTFYINELNTELIIPNGYYNIDDALFTKEPDMIMSGKTVTINYVNSSNVDSSMVFYYDNSNSSSSVVAYTDANSLYNISFTSTQITMDVAFIQLVSSGSTTAITTNYSIYEKMPIALYDILDSSFNAYKDIDISVSDTKIQIYNDNLEDIISPFDLSYELETSTSTLATYRLGYNDVSYIVQYDSTNPSSIILNSEIMNVVRGISTISTDTTLSINKLNFRQYLDDGLYAIQERITHLTPDISVNNQSVTIHFNNASGAITNMTLTLNDASSNSTITEYQFNDTTPIYDSSVELYIIQVTSKHDITLSDTLWNIIKSPADPTSNEFISQNNTLLNYWYIQSGNYVIDDASFNTTLPYNMSVVNNEIELYDSSLVEISDPFILSYSLEDSEYNIPKYIYYYATNDVSYSITIEQDNSYNIIIEPNLYNRIKNITLDDNNVERTINIHDALYIDTGLYDISYTDFTTSTSYFLEPYDLSSSISQIQLYDPSLVEISDPLPFILTYDLSNSNYEEAIYTYTDPIFSVEYTITLSNALNNELRPNHEIMSEVLNDATFSENDEIFIDYYKL